MSRQFDDMIFIKANRIILLLDQKEYDVTDHLTEFVNELEKLKARCSLWAILTTQKNLVAILLLLI